MARSAQRAARSGSGRAWRGFALLLVALPLVAAEPRLADEVVARVGREVLTRHDVDAYLAQAGVFGTLTEGPSALVRRKEEVWREALRELVLRKMVVQSVEDAALANEPWAGFLLISDSELESDLADLGRRLGKPTLEAYRQAMEAEGVRYSVARERRREWLVERRWRYWKGREHRPVSPRRMRAHYDEDPDRYREQTLRLRVLMLRVRDPTDTEAREARRREISVFRDRILSGQASLEELSRLHSNGPYAAQGGLWPPGRDGAGQELPLLPPEALPGEVSDYAARMEPGTLSPVVFALGRRLPSGETQPSFYWLFAVEERQWGPPRPFDEVQPRVHRDLEQESRERYLEQELARLWGAASIWVHPAVGPLEPPSALAPIPAPGQ